MYLSKQEEEATDFGVDFGDGPRGGVVVRSAHGKANGVVRRGERVLDVSWINIINEVLRSFIGFSRFLFSQKSD